MARFGRFRFNTQRWNSGTGSFMSEIEKKLDTKPRVKVEFVTIAGVATDISQYFDSGGVVERIKERAPDEIQAGDFDVVLINHDDYFSEYKASSLFYQTQYHGAKIRVWMGFELEDGSVDYVLQQVGYIDELVAHNDESKVTLRCRDLIRSILDQKLHPRPAAETPAPGASNVGDGSCSAVATKAFKTKDETWTLTCTTPGADGVAVFSVVGSVTGSKGNATSGTEFTTANGTGGIKFTLRGGTVNWSSGDVFTFATRRYPEWSLVNPGKIIWSILTGHNWDSGAAEDWDDLVLTMDSTLSDSNTDIDYNTFAEVIAQFSAVDALTGYAAYSEDAAELIQSILLNFLGSLYTGGDGRIRLQSFQPEFGGGARLYSDDKKIMSFGYRRAVPEIINQVTVHYKLTNLWEFSDEDPVFDGVFSVKDQTSIDAYEGTVYGSEHNLRWFSTTGGHAQDFANRLLVKYAEPPLVIEFETGSDGIIAQIGDRIQVTDEKWGFELLDCEISGLVKKFDEPPVRVRITARREGDLALFFGFLGSRIDEGDGLSPQADLYVDATASDRQFCYLTDAYRMF